MSLGLFGLGALCLMLATPAPAVDQGEITKAIDLGVAGLKRLQAAGGGWSYPDIRPALGSMGMSLGMTALAGLTLLECDVPADDPAIRGALRLVRDYAMADRGTYSVSLAIMFLDRYGDPDDVPLIEVLTMRLLGGQTKMGGWSYTLPNDVFELTADKNLNDDAHKRAELKTKPDFAAPDPGGQRAKRELSAESKKKFEQIARRPLDDSLGMMSDNSNTQFAIFALWVARRHGFPVEEAVKRVELRFRNSQNADGGWDYTSPGNDSRPTMTCAGLFGLAVAGGTGKSGRAAVDPASDPFIRGGLLAVGSCIGHPAGASGKAIPRLPTGQGNHTYYFLWGLERVCMAFDLKTIAGKDWYNWGAEILLANQQADGTWQGEYGAGGADTCFALLFLRRANLAGDLTAKLRGSVKDEALLRAGGVGGTDLLKGTGLKKSALDTYTRPEARRPSAVAKEAARTQPIKLDGEAGRLAQALLQATGNKQEQLLDKYRDSKGVEYTEALAGSIPAMDGPAKLKARDALAERLSRMKSSTLADKLSDDNFEVRRAAALACAMKEDKSHLTKLIALLDDSEVPVQRAAYAALKSLTNQDFGPAADATKTEHDKAVAGWKAWLTKQAKP